MLALGRRSKSRDRAGTSRYGERSHSRERPSVPLIITFNNENNEEEERIQPQKTRRGRNQKRSQSISDGDELYSDEFSVEDDMLRQYRKEESVGGTPRKRADTKHSGLSRSLHSPRPRRRSRSGSRSRTGSRSRSRSRSRRRSRSRSRSKSSTRRDRTNSCKMTRPLSLSDHSFGEDPALEADPELEEYNEKTQDQLREELMKECMGAIERRQQQARQLISSDEQLRRKDFDNLLKQSIKQRVTQSSDIQSTLLSPEANSQRKMWQQRVRKDLRESNYSPKKRQPRRPSWGASSDIEVSLEDQYDVKKEETKQDSTITPIKISKHNTRDPRSDKTKKEPLSKYQKRSSTTTATETTDETSHQLTSTDEFHTHLHDTEPETTTKTDGRTGIFRKTMSNITGRSRSKSTDRSVSRHSGRSKSRSRSNSNDRLKSRSRSNSNDRLKSRSRSNSNDRLKSRSRSNSNDRLRSRSRSKSNDRSKRNDRSKSRTRGVRKARSWDSTQGGTNTVSRAGSSDRKTYSDISTIEDVGDLSWHDIIRKHDWDNVISMLKSYDYARYRRRSNDDEKSTDIKESSPLLQVDANGRTPLHLACREQMPAKLLRRLILLEKNAASVKDADGRYPLHLAVIYNVDHHILDGLIRVHSDCLGVPDNLQHTPLQYAVLKADRSRGNKEVKWGPAGSEAATNRQNLQIEAYSAVLFILESMIKKDKDLSHHEGKIAFEAVKLGAPPEVVKQMVVMSEKFLRKSKNMAERLLALVFERNYPLGVLHRVLEVISKAMPPALLLETVRTRLTIHFNEGCNGISITGPNGEKVTTSLAKEFAKTCRKGGKKVRVSTTCKDWWEKLRYLIARSCNRTSNWKNDTVLHMALCNPKSQPSLIEYLCRLNPVARYKVDDVTGALPIHLAYMNWHPEQHGIGDVRSQEKVLNLLLAGDADLVRKTCSRGRIPLHHAILSGKPMSCVQIILNLDHETLSVRDPVTTLLPFQMAAKPRLNEDRTQPQQLDMIYTLLRMKPF